MAQIAQAGNKGEGIRSDCFVTLELTSSGGIQLNLKSKVKVLYGDRIEALVRDILDFFEIKNAKIEIEDTGALDFVIAARMEAAIKQLIDTDKEYLLPVLEENKYPTERDRFRITRLYLPGNTPKLFLNAGIHKPNGIILDLEDSVAPDKKDEARYLVRNALRSVDFMGAERMVRINQGERGLKDLEFVVPHYVNLILIPKVETPEQVLAVEEKIKSIPREYDWDIWYMPIIESALGIENAYQIATASPNVVAMAIGLEDLTADLGVQRTPEGWETFYQRTRLVNAAKAAGIQPIDSVFSDVQDMDGLRKFVKQSKSLGFEGMGVIHPRQIPVIHEAFMPSDEEIEKAQRIVDAFNEAKEKGLGVVALGNKMIDPPVVKRAFNTLKLKEINH
jgi:citrate lyase subunit beta/citryl-CoA lyase